MSNLRVLRGERNQKLATPNWFIHRLEVTLGRAFELDVCALRRTSKAPRYYSPAKDGLTQHWLGLWWCNPPYADIMPWVERGLEQSERWRSTGWFLLPSRTDTAWFHRLRRAEREDQAQIGFLEYRIPFEGSNDRPYEASLLVVVAPRASRYAGEIKEMERAA